MFGAGNTGFLVNIFSNALCPLCACILGAELMRDRESRGELEMQLCRAGYMLSDVIRPAASVLKCIIYDQGLTGTKQ